MEESWEREHSRKRKAGLGFQQGGTDQAEEAARHYNKLHDRHRSLTGGSDILTLRNLHNWIKSVLIARHMRSGARADQSLSRRPRSSRAAPRQRAAAARSTGRAA